MRDTGHIRHFTISPIDYGDEFEREVQVAEFVDLVGRGAPDGRADYFDLDTACSNYIIALSWGVNPFAWAEVPRRKRILPKAHPRGAQRR